MVKVVDDSSNNQVLCSGYFYVLLFVIEVTVRHLGGAGTALIISSGENGHLWDDRQKTGILQARSIDQNYSRRGGRLISLLGTAACVRQCAYWSCSTLSNGYYSLPISNYKNLRTHHIERTTQHLSNVRYVTSVTATVLLALGVASTQNTVGPKGGTKVFKSSKSTEFDY